MPLSPGRSIRVVRHAVFHDGVDDYVLVPIVLYGWREVTIEDLLYLYHPKLGLGSGFTSVFGAPAGGDGPSTYIQAYDFPAYRNLFVRMLVLKPDGSGRYYDANLYPYRNMWVQVVRRFTSDREYSVYVNAARAVSYTIPVEEQTFLERNPEEALRPWAYQRFVLGAHFDTTNPMKVSYYTFRVYSRVLDDWEIEHNFRYPYDPVRRDLEVYLLAHPDYIRDIDGDGVLEWIDLSGKGRHAKLYGARLVELVKPPAR